MVKAPYGPIPEGYSAALDELVGMNKIAITKTSRQIFYKSVEEPNITQFNANKLEVLSMMTVIMSTNFSARMITDLSRSNRYW
jgi:hypothetical protein